MLKLAGGFKVKNQERRLEKGQRVHLYYTVEENPGIQNHFEAAGV